MRRRVLLVLMIYSTVVVLALSVPLALLVGRERAQRFGENRAAAASFFAELSSREDESGVARIRESVQRYNSLYDEGVAVVDRTGEARAVSGLDLQRDDVRQAVAGALRNQRGDLPSSLTPWSDSSVLIAAPVGGGTQVDGAVVLEASTDSARRDVAITWVVIALGAMLILATVAVIAVALSRWVVRPLTALSSRVHTFGDKFHDQASIEGSQRLEPVPYVGPPEVRELSSAFEAMADDVEAATAAQRRLVADTAHALRNPLAALRIRMDVLGMRVPDSATDAHLRTTLEVDRLSSVVEDLLVLAAAETPTTTRFPGCDLGAVVADRVGFWSTSIAVADMTVHVSEPKADTQCRVAMSEDDLTRILDALLSNATKYAGAGAGIEVGYRTGDADVTMWLSDNGPGVPADELAKVVDRFYRASGAHGDGTGLGLSIVHALTERAGGSLRVMAGRPVGLRIELRLPRAVS
ncbi:MULTISPECIES: sensor histidine kinase [unclassified Rhodococcus (in: high G+C Gram-positive bacteria)]|uniref:sensor histidine kinase n=1 Tax=unclassified Rhodococcus (in: high G+C Gram-positive bacteria) TaxID=192944 RepID=UPI000AAAD176|nr:MULTISPECIES: HAMP domain-containing sensor histidine kinase [unclassified Rhodococcus (in: high G+C Gram-positive bacteria)]